MDLSSDTLAEELFYSRYVNYTPCITAAARHLIEEEDDEFTWEALVRSYASYAHVECGEPYRRYHEYVNHLNEIELVMLIAPRVQKIWFCLGEEADRVKNPITGLVWELPDADLASMKPASSAIQ